MLSESLLISCPAQVHLVVRNSLVNEVEFSYFQNVVKTSEVACIQIINYFPYSMQYNFASLNEYPDTL